MGGIPIGGSYKTNGTTITGINPKTTGKGSHVIWYSFSDGKSCTDSTSKVLKIDSVTPLVYPSLASICNSVSPVAINKALPIGGIYSGLGIINDTLFSPSLTGSGTFTIKYKFKNAFSCEDSINQNIGVDTLPNVSFQLSRDSICSNGDSILLQGTPSGGLFSGSGVGTSYFNPKNSFNGNQVITYSFTNLNGCSNSAKDSLRVDSVTNISFVFQDSICLNSSVINLSGIATPTGGSYFGSGVSSNNYSTILAGAGMDTVYYAFTNAFGCNDTVSEFIRVDTVPIVSLASFIPICSSDSLILNQGIPAGGIYSGLGVVGSGFKPSLSGIYKIKYEFTDLNNCIDSVLDSIQVKKSPIVSLASIGNICANTPDFILKNGLPLGGNYIGSMVKIDSIFSASLLGSGSYKLKYGFIDTNGCSDTAISQIVIDTIPVVTFGTIPDLCLNSANYRLKEGSPSGGKYAGVGVLQDSLFDPSLGLGTYNLKYTFVDNNTCSDSAFSSVKVGSHTKVDSAKFNDVCANGDTVKLSGGYPTGGFYKGNGVLNDSLFIVSKNQVGINTLYYVIKNKCGNDSLKFAFEVMAIPNLSLSEIAPLCQNSGAHLLIEGTPSGGKYFVNNREETKIETSKPVKVNLRYYYEDSMGCFNSMNINTEVIKTPSVEIRGVGNVCSTDSLNLILDESFDQYIWNGDTGTSVFRKSASQLAFGSNDITLLVIDKHGCTAKDSKRVNVYNCGQAVELWPNPSNGKFQIRFLSNIEEEIIITISNSIGQEVMKATPLLVPGNNIYNVVLNVGAGSYVVKIEMAGETHLEKIVVR